MKRWKLLRALSVLLALSLLLALAACRTDTPAPPETPDEPAGTQTPEPPETPDAPEVPDAQPDAPAPDAPEPPEEPEVFTFTRENLPRLDGSTSMVPLAQAVASVLLGQPREAVEEFTRFNRTTQSFRNLLHGECDLLLVGEPNAAVFDEMAEAGFEYDLETIATDALIFVVNADNPVDNLTTEQIRGIYTGQITNWSQVGGADEPIVPFQRNEGAGSQALMRKLVMGDTPMMDAPADYVATGMGELMEVVRGYDSSANAIGYSVYYYAHDMEMAAGLKLLSVDGVAPSAQTIRAEEYPHRNAYYCVIAADEPADSPARILYDWMVSEEGQRLVEAEGYVSNLGA